MISIVIPALNEEDYLQGLLESIKKQDFKDYEIILADAGSTDHTLEIAKKHGCKIIPGGLPAKGRNNGAKAAASNILFFLDADTVLSEGFLKKSIEEFNRRKLAIAGFCLIPYPERKMSSFLLNFFYNGMIITLEKVLPHSAMGILVKKDIFEKVNGFDEEIKLAEDHDFARRAAKYGTFGIMRSVKILFSDRRFRKEGWVKVGFKYFLCGLYTVFIGPIKSDIFHYKFNHYKDN